MSLAEPPVREPDPRGAVCADCGQHMLVAAGCTLLAIQLQGQQYVRVFYGREDMALPHLRCDDCGCMRGRLHHLGCDLEQCPRCRGQLLSCGCGDPPAHDDPRGDEPF